MDFSHLCVSGQARDMLFLEIIGKVILHYTGPLTYSQQVMYHSEAPLFVFCIYLGCSLIVIIDPTLLLIDRIILLDV